MSTRQQDDKTKNWADKIATFFIVVTWSILKGIYDYVAGVLQAILEVLKAVVGVGKAIFTPLAKVQALWNRMVWERIHWEQQRKILMVLKGFSWVNATAAIVTIGIRIVIMLLSAQGGRQPVPIIIGPSYITIYLMELVVGVPCIFIYESMVTYGHGQLRWRRVIFQSAVLIVGSALLGFGSMWASIMLFCIVDDTLLHVRHEYRQDDVWRILSFDLWEIVFFPLALLISGLELIFVYLSSKIRSHTESQAPPEVESEEESQE